MIYQVNDEGFVTFNDKSIAKVKIVEKSTYSSLPSDFLFQYAEGETNRQLKHELYEDKFFLPENFVHLVFTKETPEQTI